jgi:hypothetical protein
MSILIKGHVLAAGLAIVLAGPVSGQTDSAAAGSASASTRHIRFTHVVVNRNDDNPHTFTLRATDSHGNTYRMRKSDDQIVEFEINGKAVPKEQYARYEELFDELANPPAAPVAPVGPASAGAVTPAAPAAPVAASAVPAPPASPLPPTPPAPPEPPRANKYISRIIDELIDKGIIADDVKLTFSLDNEQLTVNGVKQPDEVFQAFRQKYIKHAGDHFNYERSGSSTISNIKINDDNH